MPPRVKKGRKMGVWAVAVRDLDDRGLPFDMWKRYQKGDHFWLTHEADATHFWAESESGTSTGLIARDAVQLVQPEINKWA